MVWLWTVAFLICFQLDGLWFDEVQSTPYKNDMPNGDRMIPYSETSLDPEDRLHLYWKVDFEEERVMFELIVTGANTNWVGVGFSDRGEINNADLCVLWTDKMKNPRIGDIYTDEVGYAQVDDHDDCQLQSLEKKKFQTRFVWSRKIDTCDNQDYVIEDGTTHVVYVLGKGPLKRLDGINLSKMNHGFQRVQLLRNPVVSNFPENTRNIVIKGDMVTVPSNETTYFCTVVQLPSEFKRKYHIIEYAPAIQDGSETLVHHMEVYHCLVDVNKKLPMWKGECKSPTRPKELEPCKKVLAAWAMGALPFTYPPEAGLPIGGKNFSKYVMLEVHYNNPDRKEGIIDSSGIELSYTPTLRKYDAAVMEVGLEYTDKMAIPPQQSDFALTGYCVAECTRVGIPKDGIFVFGSQLHTHLTGFKVYTKHVRGVYELPEMNRDNHYSTHYQEIRRLKNTVRVLPGDSLLTTCHFNTSDRPNITLGGYAIREEMCVNYIHYYPKTDLEVCKSSISTKELREYFDLMKKYNNEPTSPSMTVKENYESIHWNQYYSDFLNKFYHSSPLSMECNKSSGERFPGPWEEIPLTQVMRPLPPKPRQCENMKIGKEEEEIADK